MEGPRPGRRGRRGVSDLSSGKGARDENFPVASFLIAPKHREVVMRFYAVARMADDIADHPTTSSEEKLRRLNDIESTLDGGDLVYEAASLREALKTRGLSDIHVRDLLVAFRQDATQSRYADWEELMRYCRYSAAPVGRFVLDVHGESQALWPANDALCAALQVINHLQDCAKDYREMDRVYLPLDVMASHGVAEQALEAPRASPGLKAAIRELARCACDLLKVSKPFAAEVRDRRLAMEVAVIQKLAEDLAGRLLSRDPLSERVHHRKIEALGLALMGAASVPLWRRRSRQPSEFAA